MKRFILLKKSDIFDRNILFDFITLVFMSIVTASKNLNVLLNSMINITH